MSKRKKAAILFFTYGAMTLAVVIISVICIMLILGYRLDLKGGTIEQGGLFQFRSFPSGATINLDDKRLSFRTPGKYNVSSGEHTVTMKLNGYQDWHKTTSIKPGELKWLNYARFVPNDITSTQVASFKEMADTLPSPDRRWYALLTDASKPVVTLYDIRNPQQPIASTITVPADEYTTREGATHSFSLEEWDFGARYMLMRHQVGSTIEYIRLDRTAPTSVENITKEFNLPFKDIHFSGTSGNVFYALNGTDIRRIDLGDMAVTRPLVTEVSHFELYKNDTIAFIATREEKRVVGVYIDEKETIVRSYPRRNTVSVDISSYFNREYLAIGHNKAVEIIKDPLHNTDSAGRVFAGFDTQYDIAWLQFANSGRFVVVGNGVDFTTYDIETDELFISKFDGKASNPTKELQWLDDYYLVADATGTLVIGEFDGTNKHRIVSVAPGFAVTLSEDGEHLFSIGRTDKGYTLQSSQMTIN